MEEKEGGIYIHIPFCRQKCLYCDFYSGGVRIADWTKYVECVINELQTRKKELNFIPETLYLGGGTPSLIPADPFLKMIKEIKNITEKSFWNEFTLEVNPEDVNEEIIETWKEASVNRISIGIQTFNDEELKIIGRNHDSCMAEKAFQLLRKHFDNISVDIIMGLPKQTFESYRRTLEKIISLNPSHISCYSLMLEDGTALTNLYNRNKIEIPDEDEWMKMMEITSASLSSNNYFRYEISNYAKSGYESRHNSSYWQGSPYLGLGPGAHSFDGENIRRANPCDLKGYYKTFSDPSILQQSFYEEEKLSSIEKREEMIMTRMRMSKGLNINEFGEIFGEDNTKKLLQVAMPFINAGYLKYADEYLSFSDDGFKISDEILSSLI